MRRENTRLFFLTFVLLCLGALVPNTESLAYDPSQSLEQKNSEHVPEEFKDVGISENLGAKLDPDLTFQDHTGKQVKLADYLGSDKPVVLSLVYYNCPGLCNFHLNGVVESLKEVDWTVGEDYHFLVISFDSKEGSELAAAKRDNYLNMYERDLSGEAWPFLTANQEVIDQVTDKVGFDYKWVEKSQEWAHASAAIVLTPEGKISRYLYGILFEPQDIKLALNEAADGQVGGIVDRLILFCFQFDPEQNKYTLYAYNVMRAGAGLTVLLLGLWMIPVWIRQRKKKEA